MPQSGLIFRALIASPSDCVHERRVIAEVVTQWNAVHSLSSAAVLEPVMWETHSRPEMGDRPQALINKQLLDRCDLLIGAFWTRLGTPTGVAASGTVEEIEEFRKANKPVLVYFSSAPVVPESLDSDQYSALVSYRKQLAEQGLYSKYDDPADFRAQFQRHIAGTMIDLLARNKNLASSNSLPLPSVEEQTLATQRQAIHDFRQQIKGFLRRLKADWNAERDSDPLTTDDGKFILSQAANEVVNYRSRITEDRVGFAQILDEAARRLRALQRHETYMDGGQSFKEFWDDGNSIIALLDTVPDKLEEIANEGLERSEV